MNGLKQKGGLMIEVVVVSAIIVFAVLGASGVAQKSIYLSRFAWHNAQAATLLEEGAEVVKMLRDNDWANISGLSTSSTYYPVFQSGNWSLSTTPNTVGIFTRTVTVANVNRDSNEDIASSGTVHADTGTKLFTINVDWSEGEDLKNKSLSLYVSDIF